MHPSLSLQPSTVKFPVCHVLAKELHNLFNRLQLTLTELNIVCHSVVFCEREFILQTVLIKCFPLLKIKLRLS